MITAETIIDGDFASEEVTRLRNEADIIVTNPPFSKWRAFLAWIMEGHKQFLILGTIGAAGYKEVFPLIRDNQIWLGVSSNKTLQFQLPDDAAKYKRMIGDKKYADVPACTWFTNIDNIVRHTDIPYLTMEQHTMLGHTFKQYFNYDAIDVPNCADIPVDYPGTIGIPLSFLTQYNPDMFEIVGFGHGILGVELGVGASVTDEEWKHINEVLSRPSRGNLILRDDTGKLSEPYGRILIRRRFE